MAKKNKKNNFFYIKLFLGIIFTLCILVLYAHFIEPKIISTNDYVIKSSRITNNFDGFKIVHISDIHYGRMFEKKDLNKLVNKINEYSPDIVVLTGDLIDRDTEINKKTSEEISECLKKIEVSTGKYAISGNHDYKFDEWENIIKNGDFVNLNNTFETIYNDGYEQMVIAGIQTMQYGKETINERVKDSIDYINSFEKNGPIYNILLMHEPDFIDELENNKFQLILAGHSHAGQIKVPFYGSVILPEYGKKYSEGMYKINNSILYVSNGIGVSNINFRFLNIPSFNVYILAKKGS